MSLAMMFRTTALFVAASCSLLQTVSAQPLYSFPGGVETRWASPENPTGDKGRGAEANAGRKGSPSFSLKAGEQHVLAEVSGRSGTVRRIWMTLSNRTPKLLRGIRVLP